MLKEHANASLKLSIRRYRCVSYFYLVLGFGSGLRISACGLVSPARGLDLSIYICHTLAIPSP